MRNNIGVMGHPINHSVSPVFQQAALDYLGNKNFGVNLPMELIGLKKGLEEIYNEL